MKALLDRILFELAVRLGPVLLLLMGRTWRIDYFGDEHIRACRARGKPFIYTHWHGRLLPLTYLHRNRGVYVLISRSRDGEIIRRVTGALGFESVGGSTGKGGTRAILRMTRRAAEGHDLAVTPDGPRGPREEAQAGVVFIAQRAGVPILPTAAAASRGRRLRSWDRFLVPGLFSKVSYGYGPPIDVPPGATGDEIERIRLRVGEALQALTAEADRRVGIAEREST